MSADLTAGELAALDEYRAFDRSCGFPGRTCLMCAAFVAGYRGELRPTAGSLWFAAESRSAHVAGMIAAARDGALHRLRTLKAWLDYERSLVPPGTSDYRTYFRFNERSGITDAIDGEAHGGR